MRRIAVYGWTVGFNKIGFTKFLRAEFDYSLSDAKGITDGVLKNQPITLEVEDAKFQRIVSQLEELKASFRTGEEEL